jgi:hypothetical protein
MHESLSGASSVAEHAGPHILSTKGDIIGHWSIAGLPITNTIFSTWLFMGFLFLIIAFFYMAVRSEKFPLLRALGIDIMTRLYNYTHSLLGNAGLTHRYIWLL